MSFFSITCGFSSLKNGGLPKIIKLRLNYQIMIKGRLLNNRLRKKTEKLVCNTVLYSSFVCALTITMRFLIQVQIITHSNFAFWCKRIMHATV